MTLASSGIPLFNLYGETDTHWPTPDLIHSETIADRSQLHDWVIKPHRHPDLLHLLYCQRGEALTSLDGKPQTLPIPCVVLVAPMCVHGFEFSRDIDGFVLTLAAPLVKQLGTRFSDHPTLLQESRCFDAGSERALFDTLFATLDREYRGSAPGRETLIEASVSALLVLLSRQVLAQAERSALPPDRGSLHYAGFTQRLEQRYRQHDRIDDYAGALGITPAHLNTLCRRFAGRSAQQLIHDRLLLEAKRNLIYTAMTISQIADSLGFSEPAYFTRFFKRMSGASPRQFRLRNH